MDRIALIDNLFFILLESDLHLASVALLGKKVAGAFAKMMARPFPLQISQEFKLSCLSSLVKLAMKLSDRWRISSSQKEIHGGRRYRIGQNVQLDLVARPSAAPRLAKWVKAKTVHPSCRIRFPLNGLTNLS